MSSPASGAQVEPCPSLKLWQTALVDISSNRDRAKEYRIRTENSHNDRSRIEQIIFWIDLKAASSESQGTFWSVMEHFEKTLNSEGVNEIEFGWARQNSKELLECETFPQLQDIAFLHGILELSGGKTDPFYYNARGNDDEILWELFKSYAPAGVHIARMSAKDIENLRTRLPKRVTAGALMLAEIQESFKRMEQNLKTIEEDQRQICYWIGNLEQKLKESK